MPDPDDRYEEQSDLDSADLAAIRQAMEELADSEVQPSAPALEFTPAIPGPGVVGERVLRAHLRPSGR